MILLDQLFRLALLLAALALVFHIFCLGLIEFFKDGDKGLYKD